MRTSYCSRVCPLPDEIELATVYLDVEDVQQRKLRWEQYAPTAFDFQRNDVHRLASKAMQNDFSRRQMLESASAGFGMLGLASALQTAGASNLLGATAASTRIEGITNGIAPKAKRVIFLFMNGGPSHVDTFDNKPALIKHNGEKPEKTHLNRGGNWMGSPFKFSKHGESGVEMSELLPNLGQCADDMCVLRSMHTDVPNHEPGLLIMHSGHQQPDSTITRFVGDLWIGSENQNLPRLCHFVLGNPVSARFFGRMVSTGEFQGVKVNTKQLKVEQLIRNLKHPNMTREQQRMQLDLLRSSTRNICSASARFAMNRRSAPWSSLFRCRRKRTLRSMLVESQRSSRNVRQVDFLDNRVY